MNSFRVREARSRDGEAIAALWRELMVHHRHLDRRFTLAPDGERRYLRHTQEMIRSRDARVLVAEVARTGELIGFAMGELQHRPPIAMGGRYGFVSDLYVRESWRRRGVGRALYVPLVRWFLDRKASAVQLYAAQANPAALAFWQAMGFSPFMMLLHQDLTTPPTFETSED